MRFWITVAVVLAFVLCIVIVNLKERAESRRPYKTQRVTWAPPARTTATHVTNKERPVTPERVPDYQAAPYEVITSERSRSNTSDTPLQMYDQVNRLDVFLSSPKTNHGSPSQHQVIFCYQTVTKARKEDGPQVLEDSGNNLAKAFNTACSKALVDQSGFWQQATSGWITESSMDLAGAVDLVSQLQTGLHQFVAAGPSALVSRTAGFTPISNEVVSNLMQSYPLPGDSLFHNIRRFFEITGMVLGAATGNPALGMACFKAWVHDEIRQGVKDAVGEVFTGNSHERAVAVEISHGPVRAENRTRHEPRSRPARVARITDSEEHVYARRDPIANIPSSKSPTRPYTPNSNTDDEFEQIPDPVNMQTNRTWRRPREAHNKSPHELRPPTEIDGPHHGPMSGL